MSDFSREAVKLLRAAENALSGKRVALPDERQEKLGNGRDDELDETRGNWPVLELQRQLRAVMTEVKDLRNELTAERESRSNTITFLGRRWKEEMMVEIRSADHQSRRAISELEMNIQRQQKEEATARALIQRQLDDVTRGEKVRGRSQFEQQEHMQEQLNGLRERLEAAVAECGLVRLESSQQLEKERASLAHRLDTELLRYVEMRREEKRERESLRQQMKTDTASLGRNVKDLVAEAWRTHATALERTLRESIDGFARQIAQHKEVLAEMNTKVHDCITTCRAEVRLHIASLQERVTALESAAAVTALRVDRAERKADASQEAVSRADANVGVARETAERALAQALRAMERAQRMEDTVQDRDARLTQLESQVSAVTTAETLRAEIEGVRRAALRAESGVDALRQVCERNEQLAEHTRRAVEGYTDRIDGCEQLAQRVRFAVECVEGRLAPLQQRVAVLDEAREGLSASAARVDDLVSVLGQRIHAAEGKLRGLCERLEQAQRDAISGDQALSIRVEHASDIALRCETSSAAARAEVDRMSRRLCELEAQASRISAEVVASRSAAEDHAKEAATLTNRLQQMREWQEHRETCTDTAISALEARTSTTLGQLSTRLESKLQRDVHRLQTSFEERAAALEVLLEREVGLLQEQFAKAQHSLHGDGDAVQRLAREIQECRAKIDSLNNAFALVREIGNQGPNEFVLRSEWDILNKKVLALGSQIRATSADVALQQQTCDDIQAKLRQLENERQREKHVEHESRGLLNELRDETHVSGLALYGSDVVPLVNERMTTTPAALVAVSASPVVPHTTTNVEVKETAGKVEENKTKEDMSSVVFFQTQSLDVPNSETLTFGKHVASTLPLHTHQQVCSKEVFVQEYQGKSSDFQPSSSSLASTDDLCPQGSGSRKPPAASRRFTTLRNTAAARPLVKVQDADLTSDLKAAMTVGKKTDAWPAREAFLSASSVADESDRSLCDVPVTNRARSITEPTTFINSSFELSDSVRRCDGAASPGPALLVPQRSEERGTACETSCNAVDLVMIDERGTKGNSAVLTANVESTAKEKASAPPHVSWYDDWDDSSAGDIASATTHTEKDDFAIGTVSPEKRGGSPRNTQTSMARHQTYVPLRNEPLTAKNEEHNRVFVLSKESVTKEPLFSTEVEKKEKESSEFLQKRFTSFDDTTSEETSGEN